MRGVPRERPAISAAPSLGEAEAEQAGAAGDDLAQFLRRVEHQPQRDAEAVAQRRGQQAGPRGGADQGEGRQVDPHAARGGSFADDQVELEIFHRRVQDFLDRGLQPMDFVDEQHIPGLKVGQDRGKVAGLGDHRAGGRAETDPKFAGDDLRQRGLAQAGRPVQQDMIQRLAAGFRRLDEDRQILAGGLLAGEVGQGLRPERCLGGVFRLAGGGYCRVVVTHPAALCASSFRLSRIRASSVAASPRRSSDAGDGLLRLRPAVAEVDQGRQGVVGRGGGGDRGVGHAGRGRHRAGLVLQLRQQPDRQPRPDALARGSGWPCRRRRWRRSGRAATVADRIARATLPPTPCTVVSRRNQSRSAESAKPYRTMASSRTWVSISSFAGAAVAAARTGCATRPAPDSRRRPRR